MLFSSPLFAIFFAATLCLFASLRGQAGRKWLLLVASYLFYASWDYRYLLLLFLSTAIDFVAARRIHEASEPVRRRLWLGASLLTNLGILAAFKYGNFIAGNLGPIWRLLGIEPPAFPQEIPLGISFYTFQTLSYSIEVYRRHATPARSLLDFALYVSFFAQLVAGPIVRASEFLPQLRELSDVRSSNLLAGVQRFLVGLFKKVVIADNVGLFVDLVFESPGSYGALTLWCAAYAFGLQIYCDFSGYTDMALGIGRVFGFRLPENFRIPYAATSLSEFWRRWHITLSTWLRDYVYISLGGSRVSVPHTYVNLFATMLLGGLWHGAAWTFVVWGAYHGLLLGVERALGLARSSTPVADGSLGSIVRAVATFHIVTLGWVIFRSPDLDHLQGYLQRMFTAWAWHGQGETIGLAWAAIAALGVSIQLALGSRSRAAALWSALPAPVQGLGLAALVLIVSSLRVEQTAFIYFQF